MPTNVPKYWDQTLLVANNPVVGAKFFNIYIQTFIKSILGYEPGCKNVKSGVLGVVKAHYGCVEAQGRGTLHCHMLVWIKGSLDPNKLKQKLMPDRNGEFEKQLAAYLQHSIQTSVPTFDENNPPNPDGDSAMDIDCLRDFHPCLTCGPVHQKDELPEVYSKRCDQDLSTLAEACQRHCHKSTCYKNWRGPPQETKC